MAHSKSAKKRVRQNEEQRLRNRHHRSRLRSAIKKLRAAVSAGDKDASQEQLPRTIALLDRMAGRRVIHRNAAARTKSPPLPPGRQVGTGLERRSPDRHRGAPHRAHRPARAVLHAAHVVTQTGTAVLHRAHRPARAAPPHREDWRAAHVVKQPSLAAPRSPRAYDSTHARNPPPRRRPPARCTRLGGLRHGRTGGDRRGAGGLGDGDSGSLPGRAPRRTDARDRTGARGLRPDGHRGARHRHLAGEPGPRRRRTLDLRPGAGDRPRRLRQPAQLPPRRLGHPLHGGAGPAPDRDHAPRGDRRSGVGRGSGRTANPHRGERVLTAPDPRTGGLLRDPRAPRQAVPVALRPFRRTGGADLRHRRTGGVLRVGERTRRRDVHAWAIRRTLQVGDALSGEIRIVAENPGRSIHRIPETEEISFVRKVSDGEWWLERLDPAAGTAMRITRTLPGREDYAWTPEGEILMGDGSRLFSWSEGSDWTEIADLSRPRCRGHHPSRREPGRRPHRDRRQPPGRLSRVPAWNAGRFSRERPPDRHARRPPPGELARRARRNSNRSQGAPGLERQPPLPHTIPTMRGILVSGCAVLLLLAACGPDRPEQGTLPPLHYLATADQAGPVAYRDPVGAISPDGNWLATLERGQVRIAPAAGGAAQRVGPGTASIRYLAWLRTAAGCWCTRTSSTGAARSGGSTTAPTAAAGRCGPTVRRTPAPRPARWPS